MAAAARVQSLIGKAGSVAVFSKSYCPYCTRAKGILQGYSGLKGKMTILELDEMGKEGAAIQDELAKVLNKGRVTVPQIWIGETYIGGCDDLQAARSTGKLDELLAQLEKTSTA